MNKAFTIIEMLIVIIIVGILIVAGQQLFRTPDKHLIESEMCVNQLIGKFNEFLYDGIT